MKREISTLIALIGKEWTLEIRGKELITLLFCNSVVMAALIGAGISSATLEQSAIKKVFPTLLWLMFLFSAVTSLSRINEHELEERGFEGLFLSGVGGGAMYVSKVLVATVYLFASFLISAVALGITVSESLADIMIPLLSVGLLMSVGVASLTVLLAAIASTSKIKGVLLPILALPLTFPFFIAGIELTADLLNFRTLNITSIWLSIAAGADVVFILLGINLFGLALRD